MASADPRYGRTMLCMDDTRPLEILDDLADPCVLWVPSLADGDGSNI